MKLNLKFIYHGLLFGCLALGFLFLAATTGSAMENFVLEGQIIDLNAKPVAGAEVYLFKTANVKRPADFISNRTTENGLFNLQVPTGKYWALAVYRKGGGKFGPLLKGDKHSGEPVIINSVDRRQMSVDFTVLDLREAAWQNQKKNEGLVKVSGLILNSSGQPVNMAYVMADQHRLFGSLPKYFSAWTGDDGSYVIYLPRGVFYLGASTGFPPENDYYLEKEIKLENDAIGVDLTIP
ncbi:MAG: DUF4198 domain-containing protein [Proteobacteria bacterium]|nr:DUF4198 domain-containing protein [Pseudomonadota bacterium]MBU1716498.1 DUF4198 domain-containing protein [Pseudomonadota bacterium]